MKSHKLRALRTSIRSIGCSVTGMTDNKLENRNRVRALRRARRYIHANEGALARLLIAYEQIAMLEPSRRIWGEQ